VKLVHLSALISPTLLRFVLVGATGFAVDGGILTLLSVQFGLNVYGSRLVSFCVAMAVTWCLNRFYVFDAAKQGRSLRDEYTRYAIVQVTGALANLCLFSLLVAAFPAWRTLPVVPLFFGALLGLIINYSGTRFWVYGNHVQH